jgi:hypothetical protein
VGKDSMVLLNTCKANRIKVTKQFTVHTAKLEKDSVEKDSMVLLDTCKSNRIKVTNQD